MRTSDHNNPQTQQKQVVPATIIRTITPIHAARYRQPTLAATGALLLALCVAMLLTFRAGAVHATEQDDLSVPIPAVEMPESEVNGSSVAVGDRNSTDAGGQTPAGLGVEDWQRIHSQLPPGLWQQEVYAKASNTDAGDFFGSAVAMDGDTVVVGAYREASDANGVYHDPETIPDDDTASDAGAAYVFVRHNGDWSQQAYLKASNSDATDIFGYSVAIDGDTIVVGAYGERSAATGVNGDETDNSAPAAGAAYVFTRSNGVWSQQAYLKASNTETVDEFGRSVAIAGDTIVVGADTEDSNATGVNGDQNDNSATHAGAAYVFTRSGNTWSQQAYLKASNTDGGDRFGIEVAIEGDTVVVGSHYEDSSATGVDGNQADNSAPDSGAAYVFTRNGNTWSQQAYLKAFNTDSGDFFGASSVAVDANTIIVGAVNEDSSATGVNGNQADNSAPESGAAYVFTRSGSTWSQQAYLKPSNTDAGDLFGRSVAIDDNTVLVGADGEDSNATGVNGDQSDNSAANAGAAYVFMRTDNTWSQQAYLKASNTDPNDAFGYSVAISGDRIIVGAVVEDSNATGIGPTFVGDPNDNSAENAGAAYFFVLTDDTLLGDVSCDSVVNVVDALFILQYDVALRAAVSSCPLPANSMNLTACDVNGDATCDVIDALFVLQCDVGIANALCPANSFVKSP